MNEGSRSCLSVCVLMALVLSGSAVAPSAKTRFDGARALRHVQKLVSLGPRHVGSEGAKAAQDYIASNLRKLNLKVIEDSFVAATPVGRMPMKNIIGILAGRSDEVIAIAGHYDTKLIKDFKFLGANDGGSSAAAVLELARALCSDAGGRDFTYWFIFFDGEEAIVQWSERDGLYGSRHLVERLNREGKLAYIRALILLDMIGDRDLNISQESYSTRWLKELIWQVARESGYGKFFADDERAVIDDHVPFLQAGVDAVNLIDFEYGFSNVYWHTAQDTLDKISAQSLEIVGEVVLRSLPRIQEHLKRKRKRS